jgi:LysR family transcriptional regulator, nitrogen assimilation regulatory protein
VLQLRHLRYFVKIVEAGSFSRAAAAIHVAQPALSQQIAELEQILGIALLHRNARGVSPTPAGEVLFAEASAVLRQMERIPDIVRSSGGEAQGVVSIGMSSTLASFLAGAFMESSRQLLPKVSLRFTTGDSMSLKARLSDQTLDLAVVFEDEQTGGFVRRPLFRQRLFLVRRKRTARTPPSITLHRLADLPLILPSHPNLVRTLLDRIFAEAGIVPTIVAETDVFSGVLSAVQTGMGEAILPKGDFSDVPGHTTVFALPIEPPIFLTASLLCSNEVALTRAGEAVRGLFSTFAERHLHEKPLTGAEWIANSGEEKKR